MLLSLEIRDMLIIDHLELEFQQGLNVLTGETGAGKSILLESLGFVLGWRGRADLVRSGVDRGEVTAVFALAPDHPARAILAAAEISADDELILRRTSTSDGRKTARANDRRVASDVLRALSDCLLELHGQHDDKGLLDPRNHGKILDDYGGLGRNVQVVKTSWFDLGTARRKLDQALLKVAEIRAEEEYLRHALDELDALDVEPGEEAKLDANRRLMQAAERIGGDIAKADAALGGEGAEGALLDAQRWLESVSEQAGGHLDAPLDTLAKTLNELGHVQQGVQAARDALTHDSTALELVEERLFAIRGLARKHAVSPDELPSFANGLRVKLEVIDASETELDGLRHDLATATDRYDVQAKRLRGKRAKVAKKLDRAMAGELPPLKLERALFETVQSEVEPGSNGIDKITFQVATNPGAPSGAINKIASGGELSRFLLALKVCLTKDTQGMTMIFDEIDRGVGGATADAVGRRLLQVASKTQVLVVTHSPQVAARGQHHWRVEKNVVSGATLSHVQSLDAAARVDELARMLAGDTITTQARDAARALLAG